MIPALTLSLVSLALSSSHREEARPTPKQITILLKIKEAKFDIPVAAMVTLDQQSTNLEVYNENLKHKFVFEFLPKLDAKGEIANLVHLKFQGVEYPGLELKAESGKTVYAAFTPPAQSNTKHSTNASFNWRVSSPGSTISARRGEIVLELNTAASNP